MDLDQLIQNVVTYLNKSERFEEGVIATPEFNLLNKDGLILSVRIRSIATLKNNFYCPQRRVYIAVVVRSTRTQGDAYKEIYTNYGKLDQAIQELRDSDLPPGFVMAENFLDTGPLQGIQVSEGMIGLEMNTSFAVDWQGNRSKG